jgi:hypothetical protein
MSSVKGTAGLLLIVNIFKGIFIFFQPLFLTASLLTRIDSTNRRNPTFSSVSVTRWSSPTSSSTSSADTRSLDTATTSSLRSATVAGGDRSYEPFFGGIDDQRQEVGGRHDC